MYKGNDYMALLNSPVRLSAQEKARFSTTHSRLDQKTNSAEEEEEERS
jgi:hypothetical protein